jgi:long-chain-fatty-acid--[acyl-carrier-protein] ligase
MEREVVNRYLLEAGLSPLHNIRRVEWVESIPVLGTGKTDYRALTARLS